MQIDVDTWKEFRFDKLFNIQRGESMYVLDSVEGKYPYISATADNNGVSAYVDKWNQDGKYITLNYDGSVADAFYHEEKAFVSEKVVVLRLKSRELTPFIAMFLITIIQREKYRFSYGRKWAVNRTMKSSIIKLPADEKEEPDWGWMEEYMERLHSQPLETSRTSSPMSLETDKWREYRFGDLINVISRAAAHKKEDVEEVTIYDDYLPYVSRTEKDNSIDMIVRKDDFEGIEKGNAIVIGDTTSTISYQANSFIAGDHIVVIRANWLNFYTGLFIVGILQQERYRYSYGRAYKKDLILDTLIKLPASDDGTPDWNWMERYIKSLPMAEHLPDNNS